MIRKLVLLITALVTLPWVANAQTESQILGYCDGQVKTGSTDGFSNPGANQDISAAIYIPESVAKIYSGCEISQIKAGLASTLNVESLKVWIRTSLDSNDIVSETRAKSDDPSIAKGWNDFTLPAPYIIPSDTEGFYIGLTFHQKGNSVGLSVFQDLPAVDNSLWVKLGNDADWVNRSDEGILPIEAVVTGNNLPKVNVAVTGLQAQPSVSISNGEISGSVTISNKAETITGFDLIFSVDDQKDTKVVHSDVAIVYKESKQIPFTVAFDNLTEGDHVLNVRLANIKEGEDANIEDNEFSVVFNAVSLFFPRNVLVEEFTTESCSNCPRVAGYMHEMLESFVPAGRVVAVCHHAGFGTDWLTIPADNSYLWLYGKANVFAPAIKVDRFTADYLPGYENPSSIMLPESAEALSQAILARMNVPAYVSLDIEVELTDGNAHVKVSGKRANEIFTKNQPRIVVGLVEDNVKARSQAGVEDGRSYIHQHVNRAYNSTWGEYLDFTADNYIYECDLAVAPEYDKENLSVIAYIWDYDPSDADKCEVANSNAVLYKDMTDNTTSIISVSEDMQENYFSVDGIRMTSPGKGITIVRKSDGTTYKVVR